MSMCIKELENEIHITWRGNVIVFYYSSLMCSLMFALCGSVAYASVNIFLIIQSTTDSLSLPLFLCIVSLPGAESRDIHRRLRSMCHFLSLQQRQVVGVGWGDLVADISVFLILLLSCGLMSCLGMYSHCYNIVLAILFKCVSWNVLESVKLNCRLLSLF